MDELNKQEEVEINGFDDYQKKASVTAIYPRNFQLIYPLLGLADEISEVYEKIQDSRGFDSPKEEIIKELGDVMWYCAAICNDLSMSLGDIMRSQVACLSRINGVDLYDVLIKRSGHLLGKSKKLIRDKNFKVDTDYIRIVQEDLFAIVEAIMSYDEINKIMVKNIQKLASRMERGVLKGDGDNR